MATKAIVYNGKTAVTVSGDVGWTSYGGDIVTNKNKSADYLYSVVSWMYRCVDVRGNSVASMPFVIKRGETEVYEFDGVTPQGDPPADIAWVKQLPRLLKQVEIANVLGGRAYCERRLNVMGTRSVQFDWFLPWSITPVFNNVPNKFGRKIDPSQPQGALLGFYRLLLPETAPIYFEPDELIHFWLPDYAVEIGPASNYPARAVLRNAGVVSSLDLFLEGYFDRGMIKATLLKYQDGIKPEEANRVKEWWQRVTNGISNAFNSLVVRGDFEVMTIGDGIKDLRDNVLAVEEKKDIAIGMGIPLSKVDSTASTDSNRDADDVQYIEDTILPEINWIYDVVNEQMFGNSGYRIMAQPQALRVMQSDEVERSSAFAQYRAGGLGLDATVATLGITVPDGVELTDPEVVVEETTSGAASEELLLQQANREAGADADKIMLNGAQISSALAIIREVSSGSVPRENAINMYETFLGISPQVSSKLIPDEPEPAPIPEQLQPFAGQDNPPTEDEEEPKEDNEDEETAVTERSIQLDLEHAERLETIQTFKRWLKKREYKRINIDDFDPNGYLSHDDMLTIAIRETQKANSHKALRQDEIADEYGDKLATFIDDALSQGMSQIEMSDALGAFIRQEMETIFREAGDIPADEGLTVEETAVLLEMVNIQRESVNGFVSDLIEDSEEEKAISFDRLRESLGGRLGSRLAIWKNQARKVFNKALIFGRGTEMLEWRLGNTEQHCSDCLSLNGEQKTPQEWKEAGIEPQSPDLECGGWNCDCSILKV